MQDSSADCNSDNTFLLVLSIHGLMRVQAGGDIFNSHNTSVQIQNKIVTEST